MTKNVRPKPAAPVSKRRRFTDEFRRKAVQMMRAPGMRCLRRCKSSAGRYERNRKGRQRRPSRGGI
jgi:hypothetical protein